MRGVSAWSVLESRELRGGLTLLELLIVLVILGVTAGLAIPRYVKSIELARAETAIHDLRAIQAGEEVLRSRRGNYTTAALNGAAAINPVLNLRLAVGLYTYDIACGACGGATYTATATPSAVRPFGGTITLDEAGTWSGTSPFVPTAQE